jgi:hypothetical protein
VTGSRVSRSQSVIASVSTVPVNPRPRDSSMAPGLGGSDADIAAELGCTVANVGEHLRRIEAHVMASVTP